MLFNTRTLPLLAFLAVALIFGGGPRGWPDTVVHCSAVALAAWGLIVFPRSVQTSRTSFDLVAILLICALCWTLVLLLPMPASWTQRLPMRASIDQQLLVAGLSRNWAPITLDVQGTIRTLLAIFVALVIWMYARALDARALSTVIKILPLMVLPLVLLGYAQAMDGSVYRTYQTSGDNVAAGLFSNRNHFACLLGMLSPIVINTAVEEWSRSRAAAAGWMGVSVLLLLAVALTFSRTGVVLTVLASGLSVFTSVWGRQGQRIRRMTGGAVISAVGTTCIATAVVLYYTWERLGARFIERGVDMQGRLALAQGSLPLVRQYWPVGTGPGAFQMTYAKEEAMGALGYGFVNHVHNDFIEFVIEWGSAGVILLVLGLTAMFFATIRTISAGTQPMKRACAIACWLPVLHSIVDYPMRAMAVCATAMTLTAALFWPRQGDKRGKSGL